MFLMIDKGPNKKTANNTNTLCKIIILKNISNRNYGTLVPVCVLYGQSFPHRPSFFTKWSTWMGWDVVFKYAIGSLKSLRLASPFLKVFLLQLFHCVLSMLLLWLLFVSFPLYPMRPLHGHRGKGCFRLSRVLPCRQMLLLCRRLR